jgi:hypothetical protein
MGEKRNVYWLLIGKVNRKRHLYVSRRKTKIYLGDRIEWLGLHWPDSGQERSDDNLKICGRNWSLPHLQHYFAF